MIKIFPTTNTSQSVRGLYRYSMLRIRVPTLNRLQQEVQKTGKVYDERTRIYLNNLRQSVYNRKFNI